ncbi:toll/interleukin-1 receptor domain-containing protein [Streptomyces anulatus]|uniref:toll/interleukin-1 receptor domain-containing protein n=1 Tax=Streptomyces anulatus TaxID=1892 RepID=UPI0022581D92|nr:toll/interleukin-1 receptor domain-containing protein [Streptomyces anulatus]MCX4519543.1 toll/interleukin-1 receptor domain-containing protein [Streptomyces anulatus]
MTSSSGAAGFWSYTHRDDESEEGRIRRLATRIANEFEAITAEELHVFLDKEDIKWGDEWRSRIDSALTGSTFFMPIITPRFFKSEECRREVLTFSGHAASLGLDELLLPIMYIDVPGIHKDTIPDEVMALISRRQYEDWTQLRLEDENSPQYRQAVHRLAGRLVEILERAAEVEPPPVTLTEEPDSEEEPGMLELMAEAEAALPRWGETMTEFSETIQVIGDATTEAVADMERSDSRGAGFAGRLRATHQLAERIKEPVRRMEELGVQYSTELVKIDPGVLGIIRQVETEGTETAESEQAKEFFKTVRELAQSGRGNTKSFQEFSDSLQSVSGLSKSMRPLIGKMRGALQQVMDGQAVINEWERRIDEVAG